jgi:hypothetical protein
MLDLIQWPAMAVTVLGSWLLASRSSRRRAIGFWLFLLCNVLWVIWAIPVHAYGLIVLQIVLAAMNIRGVSRND